MKSTDGAAAAEAGATARRAAEPRATSALDAVWGRTT
jgi:hypothetical protein